MPVSASLLNTNKPLLWAPTATDLLYHAFPAVMTGCPPKLGADIDLDTMVVSDRHFAKAVGKRTNTDKTGHFYFLPTYQLF